MNSATLTRPETPPRELPTARPRPPGPDTRSPSPGAGRHSFVSGLIAAYIRLVGLTTRTTVVGERNLPPPPFIYAFWHGRLLFLVHSHRDRGIRILVSKSKDGELIASTIRRFGFSAIRGSSSRNARESAVRIIRCLRNGDVCGITPDGPKGPAGEVKDGVSYIARKTGCPVVPITYSVRRKRFLGSWDRFLFPFPLNRAIVVIGKPVRVAEDEDLAAASRTIGESLHRITRRADALAMRLQARFRPRPRTLASPRRP